MKRISVYIALPQYRALVGMSRARGLTFAELLRRALEQFINHEKESQHV